MKSFGCMPAVRTPEASRTLTISCPGILPSPLRDKVGAFHHDRFRGYVSVQFRSGLHPPCLRFAVAVTGHHARLGTRLRAKLCRGHYFKRLNSTSFQGTTPRGSVRADCPHTALTADVWRRSAKWDTGGGAWEREASGPSGSRGAPSSSGASGCGAAERASSVCSLQVESI